MTRGPAAAPPPPPPACGWLLALGCAVGLGALWAQALWDLGHPPPYASVWGPLRPGAPLPPAAGAALARAAAGRGAPAAP